MSEMANMMARQTFLELCIEIETLCATLYSYYGNVFEDIPEASQLWKKTALEEENHSRQLVLAYRLNNETRFEVMKGGIRKALAVKEKLYQFIQHVRSNQPDILLAVSEAIEMEEKIADLHAHSALVFEDESLCRLFAALSEADRDHISDLKRYLKVLLLPLSNMEAGDEPAEPVHETASFSRLGKAAA